MVVKAHLINGNWVTSDTVSNNINPSDTSDIIGYFSAGGPTEVEMAITGAKEALKSWRYSTPQTRFDILDRAGSEILAREEELGELLSREEGKTLPEGIGEVRRAGLVFKYMAGEALRNPGEILPSVRPGMKVEITRQAVGIVGVVTPWNFPIAIPAWKIAPALAYGNCVVFKPAQIVPASAWELCDILNRAGLPPGVLNMILGSGSGVGNTIVNHKDIDAVTFTGSVNIGSNIIAAAAARGAKVQAEMGGKNPFVVLDDADLDVAAEAIINGSFFSTGQRCTASSRIIVTKGIHNRLRDRLKTDIANLRVGHALDATSQIGPVVSESQLAQNQKYVQVGRDEGGTLEVGGELLTRDTHGYFMQPALFSATTNDMTINREEIFGPVASLIMVENYEEALAVASDTDFGLSAGIATTSLKHAEHFKSHARSGMVMVNTPTAGVDYHVPFGGIKNSSYGSREQGSYAREFYTNVKTSYTA